MNFILGFWAGIIAVGALVLIAAPPPPAAPVYETMPNPRACAAGGVTFGLLRAQVTKNGVVDNATSGLTDLRCERGQAFIRDADGRWLVWSPPNSWTPAPWR